MIEVDDPNHQNTTSGWFGTFFQDISEKSSPRAGPRNMGHSPMVCFPALLCQAKPPSAGGTKRITGVAL